MDIQHFDDLNANSTDGYVFPLVYTEYHWLVQTARYLTNFYLRNWQFIVGTAITIGITVGS